MRSSPPAPAAPRPHRQTRHLHAQPGFTLVEVLVASTILAFITLAVINAIAVGQQQAIAALDDGRAAALAEATLEEVLALPYADPGGDTTFGPDAGESTRADFDALDDYHGWSQAANSITDPAGVAYPSTFQDLQRSVTVVDRTVSVASLGGDHTGRAITVTVTDPGGRTVTLERFIAEPPA
ncbi:MAG: prepilin-type N-terminal cleavage/methylation domain-containing protein [Planctomycetota bacterium]